MKTSQITPNRHTVRRAAALAKIGQLGPFVDCHLSQFQRPGCVRPGWHLTFKQKGKTRTVYVPLDLVGEVKTWTQNYRRLKQLSREISRQSLALVRGHVANRRAAQRGRALTRAKARKR